MVAPSDTCSSLPFALLSTPSILPQLLQSSRRPSVASIAKDGLKKKVLPHKAGATKLKKKSKAVRFSTKTAVIASKQLDAAKVDEACWYQAKDYHRVKVQILGSIEAITGVFNAAATAPPLDLDEHCLRGIETSISTELYQRRKQRISTTTKSVLEQQRIQRSVGVCDPLAIRAISLRCTKEAQDSAISVGKLDSQL